MESRAQLCYNIAINLQHAEENPMKNAAKIFDIGQLIMILGSALYVVELTIVENATLTAAITVIYAISLVLILIGWIGTKDERKAEKQRKKQEEAARKAAKKAA